MTTSCPKTRRDVAAWLALPAAEKERIRRHASGCAACRAELEQALAATEHLAASRESYEQLRYSGARPDFAAATRQRRADWSWQLWRPLPAALATILLSLSLALYVARNEPPPSPLNEAMRQTAAEEAASEGVESTEPAAAAAGAGSGWPAASAEVADPVGGLVEAKQLPDAATATERVTAAAPAAVAGPGSPPAEISLTIRPASPSAALGAIRRRALSLDQATWLQRPAGFSFRPPRRPATPRRPGTVEKP